VTTVYKFWEPQLRGTLRACLSLYRDSFRFTVTNNFPSSPHHHHHHHHHQFLLSLREQKASTKHRHLVLFPAIFLTSLQLSPFPNASLWTVLRPVCLGLPPLLFPCGFQSKASLSTVSCPFLSVCPIQFYFRLLICVDISISPFFLQSSSFEISRRLA